MNMPGIEFLRDTAKVGEKPSSSTSGNTKRLWEDLYDAYLAHSRRGDRRETLALVKRLSRARAKRKMRADYTVVFARSARKRTPET